MAPLVAVQHWWNLLLPTLKLNAVGIKIEAFIDAVGIKIKCHILLLRKSSLGTVSPLPNQ